MNGNSPPPPAISRRDYEQHAPEISLHMSHFFVGYLKDIYRLFDGDLALVIVIAEVAHHNLSTHFSGESGLAENAASRFHEDPGFRQKLNACNAYSLAAATGLPRETIRRKILHAEKLGWLERHGRRELLITPKLAEHFLPDFNLNLVRSLLSTAHRITRVLESPPGKP